MVVNLPPLIARALLELRSRTTVLSLKQIHALLTTAGLSGYSAAIPRILRSAALNPSGNIDYASLLFHQIENPNPSLWNAMLQGYSLRSQHDAAVAQFTQMLRVGAIPDQHTFPVLLKSISNSGSGNPSQIHAQIFKYGLEDDLFIQNSLVSCYAKGGSLDLSDKLLDGMPHRDAVSWSAVLQGHVNSGHPEQGLGYFIKMKSSGVEIDEVTVVTVLKGSAMAGSIWLGRCIHGFYLQPGRVKRDVFVGSALIDMYAKCGCCDDANKAFDEMPFRNVVSWSSLISGHLQCNRFGDALSIFCSMLVDGPKPNQMTLASVLMACSQLGALDKGRWVHSYMYRIGIELKSVVGAALINMYAKCGCIDDAFSIFRRLPNRDVYCWTALINGFAMHGLGLECIHLFSQMLQQGVQPNEVTFLGILSACCHSGLLEEGKRYFYSMQRDHGIKPKAQHYGCVVDLLGRAGHLEEALCFIESMPVEPNVGIWGALFGSCIIHKDFVLGERVGKHMVGMQPANSGTYALLENMYSTLHRWEESASTRMERRVRRVENAAGCSWLEVNSVLHKFLASDGSHAQAEDIYATLDGMTLLMKFQGYGSCFDEETILSLCVDER